MGVDEPQETRAEVARRRLAQLAAAFDAELPAREPEVASPAPVRRVAPAHLRVVLAVGAAACVLLVWYLLAQRPSAARDVAPVGFASPSSAAKTPSSAPAAGAEVVVDVIGQVRRPGIVTLPRGSRVHEAVEAAGGLTRKAKDTSGVNMARVLEDGEQIVVGPAASSAPGGTSSTGAVGGRINLNQATVEQLDTLPGVGPVTAQAIVAWREENGRFSSVDELLDVRGIGDATLAELRDLVTV